MTLSVKSLSSTWLTVNFIPVVPLLSLMVP